LEETAKKMAWRHKSGMGVLILIIRVIHSRVRQAMKMIHMTYILSGFRLKWSVNGS
jgi:hypothetical protein